MANILEGLFHFVQGIFQTILALVQGVFHVAYSFVHGIFTFVVDILESIAHFLGASLHFVVSNIVILGLIAVGVIIYLDRSNRANRVNVNGKKKVA